jgi:hypothetical protein
MATTGGRPTRRWLIRGVQAYSGIEVAQICHYLRELYALHDDVRVEVRSGVGWVVCVWMGEPIIRQAPGSRLSRENNIAQESGDVAAEVTKSQDHVTSCQCMVENLGYAPPKFSLG